MQRPDLDILVCVNSECQRFRLTGQDNLTVGAFATPTTVVCEALSKRKPFEMSPDLLKGAAQTRTHHAQHTVAVSQEGAASITIFALFRYCGRLVMREACSRDKRHNHGAMHQ
jgi:hypothetical protein